MFRFTISNPNINSGSPLQIDEPIGWKDIEFVLKRDKKYHGFLNEISLPLRFVGNAYAELWNFYQSFGADNEVQLLVEYECGYGYDTVYVGMIAISRCKFGYDKGLCYLDANLENNTVEMIFWNRMNQKVNLLDTKTLDKLETLDVYARAPYDLTLHSKTIHKQNLFQKLANYNLNYNTYIDVIDFDVIPCSTRHVDKTVWVAPGWDTEIYHELPDFQKLVNSAGQTGFDAIDRVFICTESGDYYIKFCFSFEGTIGAITAAFLSTGLCTHGFENDFDTATVDVYFKKNGTTVASTSLLASVSSPHAGPSIGDNDLAFSDNFGYDGILHLDVGDELFIYFEARVEGEYERDTVSDYNWKAVFDIDLTNNCCFIMDLDSTFEPTKGRVFAINEAFSRIAESVTNKKLRAFSSYFGRTDAEPYASDSEGCGAFTTITNGLLLRGKFLTLADERLSCQPGEDVDATIYNGCSLSFEELFDAMNAVWNIGMSYESPPNNDFPDTEKVIRIESKEYFYDQITPPVIELKSLLVWQTKVVFDEFFAKIIAGYEKWEAEDFNSIDEFNTSREYSTLLKFGNQELDIKCKFIASGYAIEVTRRQQNTNDFKYDNDIFIICTKQDVSQMDETEQDENATPLIANGGLFDGSHSYNLRIAPQRNLFRWFPILMQINHIISQTYKEGNDREQYNVDVCCDDYTAILAKDESPKWDESSLSVCSLPYYKLEELTCDYPLTYQEYKYLKTVPYCRVIVTDSGAANGYYFIREIRYKPVTGMASFVLIPQYNQ